MFIYIPASAAVTVWRRRTTRIDDVLTDGEDAVLFGLVLSVSVCVECLIGKQKKPILFKVTEPSSIPYRTHPACAKRAAYPDPPPVIPVPESIAAQAVYQLRYKSTEYCSWVSSGPVTKEFLAHELAIKQNKI